jgi:hypothetical protein
MNAGDESILKKRQAAQRLYAAENRSTSIQKET